jgi:hypothetical protein
MWAAAHMAAALTEDVLDAETLLEQIYKACRSYGIAETTFGRRAVNDGKLVTRLQSGGRVTLQTVERVLAFIEQLHGVPEHELRSVIRRQAERRPHHEFRFFDNRQKYLMFVNTSSEKKVIADLAVRELANSNPKPPAIRLFDAGTGDGTALARIMRTMHHRYKWLPFYIVAKEISMENVRLTLEKMADRFFEHPATTLVITNLRYSDAPWLRPSFKQDVLSLVWQEVPLVGDTAAEFEEQITALQPFLSKNWQASISERSGNPIYERPVVLVLYREDHRFLLDPILPKHGFASANFDLVLLSQPYRRSATIEFKVSKVIAPLAQALGPGGRLLGIQSFGKDPGLELVRSIWPGIDPFVHDRHDLMQATKAFLGEKRTGLTFHALSDSRAVFRYDIQTLPTEIASGPDNLGTSTLLAAWNAAIYAAQIDDRNLASAMANDAYLDATRTVLQKHQGLWFFDEMFTISRSNTLV